MLPLLPTMLASWIISPCCCLKFPPASPEVMIWTACWVCEGVEFRTTTWGLEYWIDDEEDDPEGDGLPPLTPDVTYRIWLLLFVKLLVCNRNFDNKESDNWHHEKCTAHCSEMQCMVIEILFKSWSNLHILPPPLIIMMSKSIIFLSNLDLKKRKKWYTSMHYVSLMIT